MKLQALAFEYNLADELGFQLIDRLMLVKTTLAFMKDITQTKFSI